MTNRQKAFLAIFLGSFIGGAVAAATKVGLTQIPPLSFAFLRFLLALLLLLPFVFKKKNLIRNLKLLVPVSLLATGNIILFVLGIKYTTATIGQLLYAGSPIIIAFLTHFLLGERLKKREFYGILSGFLGVGIVVSLPIIEKGKQFSGELRGNFLIVLGVILWSLYLLMSKRVQKIHSPFSITFAFIFVTTIALLPFFIADLYGGREWFSALSSSAILSLIYVSILGTVATYLLNQYALKHGGAVFASMNLYLLPIFAFLSAFVLLGEKLTPGVVFGGALALFGIFLTTKK